MKPLRLLLPLFLAHGALLAADQLPQRFPMERYAKLRGGLPFAVATAEAAPEEKGPGWADNLYLGSVARASLSGSDRDWVVIKDRTQPGVLIILDGYEPNSEGYQLVKLEYADDPKKTKASIKRNGEFATLEVDQAAYTGPAAPPAAAGGVRPGVPGQPGVPGANPSVIRQPNAPAPNRAPVIPRPNAGPAIAPPPLPGQQPGVPPAGVQTRPRQRVINSRP